MFGSWKTVKTKPHHLATQDGLSIAGIFTQADCQASFGSNDLCNNGEPKKNKTYQIFRIHQEKSSFKREVGRQHPMDPSSPPHVLAAIVGHL